MIRPMDRGAHGAVPCPLPAERTCETLEGIVWGSISIGRRPSNGRLGHLIKPFT